MLGILEEPGLQAARRVGCLSTISYPCCSRRPGNGLQLYHFRVSLKSWWAFKSLKFPFFFFRVSPPATAILGFERHTSSCYYYYLLVLALKGPEQGQSSSSRDFSAVEEEVVRSLGVTQPKEHTNSVVQAKANLSHSKSEGKLFILTCKSKIKKGFQCIFLQKSPRQGIGLRGSNICPEVLVSCVVCWVGALLTVPGILCLWRKECGENPWLPPWSGLCGLFSSMNEAK